jgi:sorbitol-6-phosphate 2-dehydrogenase
MDKAKEILLKILPAIRMIISGESAKNIAFVPLDQLTVKDPEEMPARFGKGVSVIRSGTADQIISETTAAHKDTDEYIFLEGLGLVVTGSNRLIAEQKLSTVTIKRDPVNIPESIKEPQSPGLVYNKIVMITGAAQGFGEGIAKELFQKGANIVIADINDVKGERLTRDLNLQKTLNRAMFVKMDVTDPDSVEEAVFRTVMEHGGLDILISNAGILKAGSLDEMDPESFSRVTAVNYNGFYHCTRAVARVMKVQSIHGQDNFSDIIQINSKSGLSGSKRNFAYAGSKFGGIGLVQSFAMELIEHRIKVNAICPGNFFEGPLWSDPEDGLFVQYLNTGKVPGAKSIADVRRHYESMVPAGRGCRIEDVVKAILYLVDQEYETGQALPVTGGQEMLR